MDCLCNLPTVTESVRALLKGQGNDRSAEQGGNDRFE